MSDTSLDTEPPQNGLAGLKHWRYDLMAGLQVALVSLPLSLGIAVASGAPPVTGLISAIIAGLIFPFLGGAYVTISGPAAGLAPALLAGMLLLGDGDLAAGYPLLLVAIFITGLVQIVLSVFKAGQFALFLPVTVVEAMLAAIGIMIILKQIPTLLGDLVPPAKNMLVTIANLPASFLKINPAIALIGGICLLLMFYLNGTRHAWMRRIPPPLSAAAVGIALGYLLQLEPHYLIAMPDSLLDGGLTLPAFDKVWARADLWWSVLLVVVTLTLIDSIESLATIRGVDKIDPYQRKSHPNVTLRAMGVSNTLSSIFGGLTIIPGGIKSRANIDAGGRTLWSNFYNSVFLIVFLFFAKDLIARIPLAAVGAILVYVGWRLCEIRVFRKTLAIGRDQILIFLATIAAILATDLLAGILIGVAAEIVLLVYLLTPSLRMALTGRLTFAQLRREMWRSLAGLFRNPVLAVKVEERAGRSHYRISLGSVTCFNLLPLENLFGSIPPNAGITLSISDASSIIDHTAMEYLHGHHEQCLHDGRPFEILGLDDFYQFAAHSLSSRMRDAKLVKEQARQSSREKEMAQAAQQYGFQFAPGTTGTLNSHNLIYLRHGVSRQQSNVMTGTYRGCHVTIFDFSHTAAQEYFAEDRHTLILLHRLEGGDAQLPDLAITPVHTIDRYLVEYREVDLGGRPELARHYRLHAQDPERALTWTGNTVERLLVGNPGFYVEIRDNVLLAFRTDKHLEPADAIPLLLAFSEPVGVSGRAELAR